MRKKLLGALGLLTFTAAPLLAQAPPPPLPVPYNPPAPAASTAAYQAPASTTTTTVYQAPPAPPPPPPPSEGIAPPAGAVPVFPDYGGPVPMRLIPVETGPYHVWVHAELLLWWVKSTPLPAPIATVTDAAGNSSTVIGNSNTSFGAFSGGRIAMGAWFDRDNHLGAEVSFFGLERRTSNQGANSDGNGIPSIGLSFLNATPGGGSGEFIQPLSTPGTFGGGVFVSQNLQLWGTEVNAAFCFLRSGGFEVTALAGFRYMDLQENLYINANSTDLTSGNFINLNDQFSTRNQFYGGQIGAKFGWETNRLSLEATGKLAIGGTHQVVDIQGSSFVSGAGYFPNTGFYAQPSNVGHYTATEFGIIPSVELKLSYQLSRAWRLFVGYDFLYWNQVVRPGNQIDRNVNLNQSPVLGTGATGGPASPMPLFNRSDFWAQGLNLGFELRF